MPINLIIRTWRPVLAASLVVALAPLCGAAELRGLQVAPFSAERTGTLSGNALREVSGMAASRRQGDLFWVHNDSGSRAQIHAISSTGRNLGTVKVRSATARDWEDMAAFEFEGRPMLVVADTGDNESTRAVVWLHFIEEPVVPAEGLAPDAAVDIAWSVPLRFPGGAADCESIAVDIENDQVLLLTKRQTPPGLYAVPIKPEGAKPSSGRVIDATKLGDMTKIPKPLAQDLFADPVFGTFSSQPTAMDLAGNELIVLTYRHAYQFVRAANQTWNDVIGAVPTIVPLPKLKQGESIAFDRLGRDFYVSSERLRAPIYRLNRIIEKNAPDATGAGDRHVD